MFLWRSLDPRTLSSVLGWMADRQRRKAEAARPAATPARPAPSDGRVQPMQTTRRSDTDRR
jgi:hypothetical protein